MNIRKMVLVALFSSLAIGIYALESLIPPIIPLPGVKLGLSNIITLVAIYTLGKKEAFATLMIRIIVSSLLFGQTMSFFFSITGGLLCFLSISISSKFLDKSQIWATSIIGALSHSLGQILVAIIITGQVAVAYYFLIMEISSIITGLFTGLCASYCVKRLQ